MFTLLGFNMRELLCEEYRIGGGTSENIWCLEICEYLNMDVRSGCFSQLASNQHTVCLTRPRRPTWNLGSVYKFQVSWEVVQLFREETHGPAVDKIVVLSKIVFPKYHTYKLKMDCFLHKLN